MLTKQSMVKAICLFIAVSLGLLLGWHTLSTPEVITANSDNLSAERMIEHLNVIATEQRSEFDFERRMYVRDYIISVMEGYGLVAEIDDFEIEITTYRDYLLHLAELRGWTATQIETHIPAEGEELDWQLELEGTVLQGSNVLFRQQGRSDTAIMLIAHIDSGGRGALLDPARGTPEWYSPGAADAGYGLTTMLEIARYFAGRDLENSIYFLFTDLHEISLRGASHALESMDFSNVGLILNLEARGIRGPVHMFEVQAGAGDLEAMRFFRRAIATTNIQPMTLSLSTAIYRFMPNSTDLTPFLNSGFAGMNFAPMDSLRYYHTPYDNLDNISPTTMQHYVSMIGGLVERFVTNHQYSDPNILLSDRTGVYFVLPFRNLVLYSDITAMIFGTIMLVAVVGLAIFLQAKKQIKLKKLMTWMLIIIGSVFAVAVFGLLVSLAVSLITGVPFNPVFMGQRLPHAPIMFVSLPIALVGFCLLHKWLKNKFNRSEMVVGAMMLLALLNMTAQFLLVEATFLLFFPIAVAFLCFVLSNVSKDNTPVLLMCAIIPTIFTIMLLAPIAFSITLAVTTGGLFMVMALSVVVCMALPALWRDV